MKLTHSQYGKSRVRVARIVRGADGVHTFHEAEVQVLLRGAAFTPSYTAADNSMVVPTDTMKNTVNVLARTALGPEIERFGAALGRHFLENYAHVESCEVTLTEKTWQRIPVNGAPHAHAFTGNDSSLPWACVTSTREAVTVQAGVREFIVLKTGGSGFAGYPKCALTTLPETDDRVLSTNVAATWDFATEPADYAAARQSILARMLEVFALNYSPSVQVTLFEMGSAALTAVPEISRIRLALPNRHYLPVNFAPFGRMNAGEVFTPTDEPHGQIEATVER